MKTKYTLPIILLIMVLQSSNLFADEAGKCGSLSWSLNSMTGEMIISGSGAMPDYHKKIYYESAKKCSYCYNYEEAPWNNYKSEITSLVIKEGCKAIGNYAFSECINLVSVTFPNSLNIIGDNAFYGCSKLTSVTIPINVTQVGAEAFQKCPNLQTVVWNAKKCPTPHSSRDRFFDTNNVAISSFVFGNQVEYIPAYLCGDIQSLKQVTIPMSVKEIGESAFLHCDLDIVHIDNMDAWLNITFRNESSNPIYHAKSLLLNGKTVNSVTISQSNGVLKDYVFYGHSIDTLIFQAPAKQISNKAFSERSVNVVWNVKSCPDGKNGASSPLRNIRDNIESITFGNEVARVPSYFCYNMSKLRKIKFGKDVKSIGVAAFWKCSALKVVFIPKTVTLIGKDAFEDCHQLNVVNIDDISKWFNIQFSSETSNPLYYAHALYEKGKLVEHITIPDYVSRIYPYAFFNCRSLKTITIGNGCTDIGDFAFYGCTNVSSLSLPDHLKTIRKYAFARCSSLSSVRIPASVTDLGESAFWLCADLASVELPKSINSIGNYAFLRCDALMSINVPASIKKVGTKAFGDIPNVNYTGSLKTAQWEAKCINGYVEDIFVFKDAAKQQLVGCSNIAKGSIVIPSSTKNIAENAFMACKDITNIALPAGLLTIGNSAFANCRGLKSVRIPNTVTNIGREAFSHCSQLDTIFISKSVNQIGEDAFYACRKLRHLEVDAANTMYVSVDGVLFNKTKSTLIHYPIGNPAKKYSIPNGVKYITDRAFWGSHLERVTFPSTIVTIGKESFAGNLALDKVYLPNTLTTIDSAAFMFCTHLSTLDIPSSVTTIGESAFYGCQGLLSAEIKGNNTIIAPNAFAYCGLLNCTIPRAITNIGNHAFDQVAAIQYRGKAKGAPWGAILQNRNPQRELLANDASPKYVSLGNEDIVYHCPSYIQGEIAIEEGTEIINYYTFNGCSNLSSVILPTSLKTIQSHSFKNCASLESIHIPEGVSSIGGSAFANCWNLKEVVFDKDAVNTSIDASAFTQCHNLQDIYYPEGNAIPQAFPKDATIHWLSNDPSHLVMIPGSLKIMDGNDNHVMETDEPCEIHFTIKNDGLGNATGIMMITHLKNENKFLHITTPVKRLPDILAGDSFLVKIPFEIDASAITMDINAEITFTENHGSGMEPVNVTIPTTTFQAPKVTAGHTLFSHNNVAKKEETITLSVHVQNTGMGIASNVIATLNVDSSLQVVSGDTLKTWKQLYAGEQKEWQVKLLANAGTPDKISIGYTLSEKYGKYAESGSIPIVFGETPTHRLSSSEDKALSIAGKPQIKLMSKESVAVSSRSEWFTKHKNDQNQKSPFPYAAIKLELKGTKEAVELAKQQLSLTLNGNPIVVEKYDKETNTIWFLVHIKNEFIDLDCGDGCEPITIWNGRLQPNKIYHGSISVSIPK